MRAAFALLQVALLLCQLHCVDCASSGKREKKQCNPNQRGALNSLFRATSGHNWFSGWDSSPTSDPCLDEWYGVTCDREGNVRTVELYGNNLAGYIPDNFGQLTKLRKLDLSKNQMSKPLPSTFAALTELRSVKLSQNHFQGDFPVAVANWKYLQILELDNNDFNAPLPQEITTLPSTKGVRLSMESYKCKTDTPSCNNALGIKNTVSFGGSTVKDRVPPVMKAPTPPCPIGYHKMAADKTNAHAALGSYSDRSWCRLDAQASAT